MKLETTDTQHRDLWKAVDGARGETVKVKKDALRNLLLDHAELVGPLERKGLVEKQP